MENTAAYFAAWLVNPHLKKPISPLTILEGLRPDEVKRIKAEQAREDIQYLSELFPGAFGISTPVK